MTESGGSLTTLVPTRTQGLTQLNDLAEVIGDYATSRNYADGMTTSRLSPYIRRRLILEEKSMVGMLTFVASPAGSGVQPATS